MLSQPYLDNIVRSSRLQIFFKISVAVAALKVCTFVKKKLQHSCFPVNIAKNLRTPVFYRTPLVAFSALYRLLFCAISAQADQGKIV